MMDDKSNHNKACKETPINEGAFKTFFHMEKMDSHPLNYPGYVKLMSLN